MECDVNGSEVGIQASRFGMGCGLAISSPPPDTEKQDRVSDMKLRPPTTVVALGPKKLSVVTKWRLVTKSDVFISIVMYTEW